MRPDANATPAESDIHSDSYSATYCMDDDKIRLYTGRVARSTYDALVNAGYKSTPKQSCDFVATWSIRAEDLAFLLIPEDADIEDEDISPEERAADRAERFAGYRDKRRAEAGYHADRFEAGPDAHGFQNPARAERAAARHDRQRDKALCQWSKAEYWQSRTAGVIAHALHRSDAATRRGRILEIEKEMRRIEAQYTPCPKTRHIMQGDWRADASESDKQYEHAWCGSGRGGHWVRVDRLDAIKASYARYIDHLNMRLIYENGMLANEGGKAADVEMVAGGFLGGHQIQKVNRSAVTGRVVSVALWGEETGYYKETNYKERTTRRVLRNINIERCGESVYRAPTEEELEAFNAQQKEKKATAKANSTAAPALINPTDEDAQALQDLWNAAEEARKPGFAKRVEVLRLTQAQYSAHSKGTYSALKTIDISPEWVRVWATSQGPSATTAFKLRVRPANDYYQAPQVIVITDKPQKALPAIPAPAPTEPVSAGCLF